MKRENIFVRLISVFLCFVMLFTPVLAGAQYINAGEANYNFGNVNLKENTETELEFYLPFDSKEFSFEYLCDADFSLTIATGRQSKTILYSAGANQGIFEFSDVERSGEKKYRLKATADVEIKAITYKRYDFQMFGDKTASGSGGEDINLIETDLTDNEKAICDAFIINRDASCIIVNGGKRYIDFDDITAKPVVSEGRICLPARVLALALGYYFENNAEKNYIFLRNSETGLEYYFNTEGSYKCINNGEKEEMNFLPVYKGGEAYLPVRYFAEELGKTVGYRDGVVIIDDKYSVEKIINDGSLFEYVLSAFSDFTLSENIGNTYHVSSEKGNDENNGSIDAPFLTLDKAGKVATAGDTVIIHEGTYREVLAPENDGTANAPITFTAADGEDVIISALEQISGFKSFSDEAISPQKGLIAADINWDLGDGRNQMFLNGECIAEARYPDGPGIEMSENGKKLSPLFPTTGDFKVNIGEDNYKRLVESDTLLQEEPVIDWSGATYVSMHAKGHALCTAKIESSEKGKLYLEENKLSKLWWWDWNRNNKDADGNIIRLWDFGYISGHINAISKPGEWVIKNKKLIMMPFETQNVQNFTVEMKKRQLVIDIADRKYIRIQGINTIGGGVRMNNSEMCVLDHMNMSYISHYTYSDDQRQGYIDKALTKLTKAEGAKGAPPRGEVGIYVGGRNNAIINSEIDHSAAAGLYLTGTYAYIDNNIISNCGYMGSYVSGIFACTEPWKADNARRGGFYIYNNTVYNSGRALMNVLSNEGLHDTTAEPPFLPFEIAYNDFHDGILFSVDAGLIYEYRVYCSTDKRRSKIHDNYVYMTTPNTPVFSFGIYHDGYSLGTDSYNNVIFTTEDNTQFTNEYDTGGIGLIGTSSKSNNSEIKTPVNGVKLLSAEHFPLGKPFYAGNLSGLGTYFKNFNKESSRVLYIPSEQAKNLSQGASIDADGKLIFSKNGDSASFELPDLSGYEFNTVELLYTSDMYKHEKVDVNDEISYYKNFDTLYLDIEYQSGEKRRLQIKAEHTADGLDDISCVSEHYLNDGNNSVYYPIEISKADNIKKLTITTKEFNGVKLYGILFAKR